MAHDLDSSTAQTASERPTRTPTGRSLVRAAVGGIVAGGVFIGLNMWFATTQGQSPLAPLKLIATLVLGGPAQQLADAAAWAGIGIHVVLSVLYGLAFGLVAPWFRRRDSVVSAGLVYGALLYVVNFQVLARVVVPQFQNPNQALEGALHLLFGAVLAAAVMSDILPADVLRGSSSAPQRWLAAIVSSGVLIIHFGTAGHHLEQEPYVGVLFVVGSAVLAAVAILLTRRDDMVAWTVGAVVHAGMFVGLPVSRTVGLPLYERVLWPTLGTETLVLEAVYLLLFVVAIVRWRRTSTTPITP